MLGLPASTQISKQLPKKAIYAKFDLKPEQRDRFDADVSKMTIVNALSTTTIPALQKGETVECIYVVEVILKRPNYDQKNILLLSKLIPQNIVFVLNYDGKMQLAIYHGRLMAGVWAKADDYKIELKGLNLDKIWENLITDIGDIVIEEGNTLDKQIEKNSIESMPSPKKRRGYAFEFVILSAYGFVVPGCVNDCMKEDITKIDCMQQEFAYVDSIITAHTNMAIAKVNAEQLQMCWEIGAYISQRLRDSFWGDHVVSELADYLKRQNPKRRGYSKRNLYNMVRFYDTYSVQQFEELAEKLKLSEFVQSQTAQIKALPIVQLPTAQLVTSSLPPILTLTSFTAHIEILNRCKTYEQYVFYILYSAEQHLNVVELRRSIVNQTYQSLMSKEKMMSPALLKQYPGAEYMLKDQMLVDFLHLKASHTEPQLHSSLLENMKQFILELGKEDFLYIEDEYTVKVGNKSKRIDLVFYHRSLHCLVAVELKAVDFESEFVSKMDMYLETLDRNYRKPDENPSMGIILCPSADRAEVEYSLNRTMSPTMVAEYNRILVPRDVATKSLAEYCEFLKKQYGK